MSQPEAPLTADALRVGETATRYEGDPVVTRIDSDGDGRVDRVEVDYDADGDSVADQFGFGFEPGEPYAPTYVVDRFPEVREGITVPAQDEEAAMSQPDAPLTADDLDIAARATVYTGDPIVHREDTDGDGRIDRIEVDYDADGDPDLIERDTDGDGRFDDTWVTTNTSSNVTGFADNDGDGHYERVLRDTDGDGVSDGVEEDLDGDGVADRFGLGLGPDDPFGEPELWVDNLPEPRDGMTADDAAGFPPLRGPDDLNVPDAAVADTGFGSGADEPVFVDGLRDAPTADEAAAYVDPLAGRYVIEDQPPVEPELPSTEAPQDELDAANAVNDGPFGSAAESSDVDDAYASPVFAPVAEASQVDDAMADPDDDAYVG